MAEIIHLDQTPKTFADLKPPGYWHWDGKEWWWVPVRLVSDEEISATTQPPIVEQHIRSGPVAALR